MYVYTHTRTCIYSRDRESEQDKKIKNYVLNKLESKFNDASKGGYSDYISVYYFMTALILDIFLKILQMDGTLAVLSVAFVFSYIWVATGWHSRKSALQSCEKKKKLEIFSRFFFLWRLFFLFFRYTITVLMFKNICQTTTALMFENVYHRVGFPGFGGHV